MARRLKIFLSLSAAFLGNFVLSDNLNAGGNWPRQPYWFPNTPGGTPAPQTQNSHTNWPQPYAYQPFSQPPPFGFAQVPQPMYYSSFPPQSGPELVQVDAPDTDSEMLLTRSMHQPSSAIAGSLRDHDAHNKLVSQCSRWHSPSPRRDVQQHMMEDIDEEPVSSHHDRKGKGKASRQQLDRDREVDDYHHQRDEYRENEREVERARRRAEQAPILQHILDMQARDFADAGDMCNDHTANMLRSQLSMNADLMRHCTELEKMLMKRQLSPGGYLGHHMQHRIDAELDEFLEMDDDYPLPCRQWNREHGRGIHGQSWQGVQPA
ncbi:hypothetical protein ARMGADRAFT_1111103 [Armillaria gallica]|uniref:Uncharacterized protein n=1 Tax=Armillaria gallica TaxID=47427 RepID=A0A2H3D5W4_ARMGA|nr:hypothetical protein ARMGADRAFT_1111103 [Armillaria gallica]